MFIAMVGGAAARDHEQIISREAPAFSPVAARLAVGRDGMVYLCSGGNNSYVLRLRREGKSKFGSPVVYAAGNATANADGVVATSNAHFAHKIALYNRQLESGGAAEDFLVNDQVGWDAPAHVEAGTSGDFYGIDQHRDRIVRITAGGKVVKGYAIPHQPAGHAGLVQDFRVCEKVEAFYLLSRSGPLRCVGFDGKERWTFDSGVGWGETGNSGGFDVDEDGSLYAIGRQADKLQKVTPDGKPGGEIKLKLAERRPEPAEHGFTDLRIVGNEVLLKRKHLTELFQHYDLTTGAFLGTVHSDHERLTVTDAGDIWTAGEDVPFRIRLIAGERELTPRWRVWARPVGALDYREWPLKGDRISLPANEAGIYQVKVTPEVRPLLRGTASEYQVRTWVEVRAPGARGTASVLTPDNRVFFGRGEEIPFAVIVRTADADQEVTLKVRLTDDLGGPNPLGRGQSKSNKDKRAIQFTVPGWFTAGLRPGRYQLAVVAPGLASVPQPLVIGRGLAREGIHRIQFGDYTNFYPAASMWDAPDLAAAQAERTARLGTTLLVERLGTQTGALAWGPGDRAELDALAARLRGALGGIAPEKASSAPPLMQALAANGASGAREMAILMSNDAGLPLGTGFDRRKPEELTDTIAKVTRALAPYPAFRGWSWASNWWVFGKRGADAAHSPEEKAAYQGALEEATKTGAWAPVLDRVAGYRLGYAAEAERLFNRTLRDLAPGLKTAAACPYRNVESYPPITLANVEEVDLQAQWEQIAVPYATPHGVDFYKRPGKPAWAHPEIWNDAGTGEQVLPTLFAALMRGADGVGCSGPIPPWGAQPEDPRSSYAGTASVFRAFNKVVRAYGPWLATLESNDRVAIVVSGRMLKIDEWRNVYGTYFSRLFEAYASCLHAHQPARYVFVDDLKPDTLKQFQAVLVVGQTVALEPGLTEALDRARRAGVTIFHDATCRASLVKDFTPLGVAFDKFEKDPSPASDDAAYERFPGYCLANVPALSKALAKVESPAVVDNPEVFVSERKAEQGRYLFVVNNTTPKLGPGHIWRTTLLSASQVPVRTTVRLGGRPQFVYDVFAARQVAVRDGTIEADCRSLPCRVFAVLPAEIDAVRLRGPSRVGAGGEIGWQIEVQDGEGKLIPASVPIRVRLVDEKQQVLEEQYVASDSRGAGGAFVAARMAVAQNLTLEATELLSGKTARLRARVLPFDGPEQLVERPATRIEPRREALSATASAVGKDRSADRSWAENDFGPHVRDVVISADGSLALLNTMNWDHNLYALDTRTGEIRWRQRVGHYFAFGPQALRQGFAVQGFDLNSAEGYHLYLADADGALERRFALYGLPKRQPHRFVPGILNDRINNFAVPEDGSWVASAGDLGLAVWDRKGSLLWSEDWWKAERHTARLAALDDRTLLVLEGMKARAFDAATGNGLWQLRLAATGEVLDVLRGQDGKTVAILTTTDGGRVFVLRDGKVAGALPAVGASAVALSPDGSRIAVIGGNQLRKLDVAGGLQWSLPAEDALHYPRFSADGKRIAVSSELGMVYVLDEAGKVLLERDLGALAVPAWLPDGSLLLATWMGTVCRLDRELRDGWRARLAPTAVDVREKLLAADSTPTARVERWGNAEPTPEPLMPNLLDEKNVVIKFCQPDSPHVQLVRAPGPLVDGKGASPPGPWLDWHAIGWLAEGTHTTWLEIDTYRTRLRVTAVSLAEDPAHPESWLRDAQLDSWDAVKELWVPVQPLLSNAAVHTHKLARPVEASRFRIVMPRWLVGNLRLAQVVLHGEKIGPAHPDVIARRPVAVLFDEADELKECLVGVQFRFEGAYSGGRCLSVPANGFVYPAFVPPFGHVVPTWDFEIAEKPGLGQYRFLQFAWRALSPETKGMLLRLDGDAYGNAVSCYAGQYKKEDDSRPHKIADAPPTEWKMARVDLWQVFGKPVRIRGLRLGSTAGPAAFDQVLLGRTEKDLEGVPRAR